MSGTLFQLQRAHKNDEPAVSLHAKKIHPSLRLLESWAYRVEPLHCGKRLGENEDAVRICSARRSAFKRLTGFKRPAGSTRLEFLELFVLFEPGIVMFPPGPGAASSSRESNSSELLTLITLLALLMSAMFSPREGGAILVLLVTLPPVVTLAGEAGPNGGALLSG